MNSSTYAKIALTAFVILGGVVFFAKSASTSTTHFQMVDKLVSGDVASWNGKELKVGGWVAAGSLKEKVVNQETIRTFLVRSEGKRIRVFHKGPKPDTLKDDSEVVATGTIVPAAELASMAQSLDMRIEGDMAYVVHAHDLMAKCPSKYEGAQSIKDLDRAGGVDLKQQK